MNQSIQEYNNNQLQEYKSICDLLANECIANIPNSENKVWHGGPVWFINGNPVVGYWVRKSGVQLLFWSGQSFDEPNLIATGRFKAAEVNYATAEQINTKELHKWLKKAQTIQWDYKNIVKRRGVLERL